MIGHQLRREMAFDWGLNNTSPLCRLLKKLIGTPGLLATWYQS